MSSRARFTQAAFLAAVLGGLVAAFAPLGRICVVSAIPGQPPTQERCSGVSIFETDGSWVLVVVTVPIVIALIPVLVRHRAAAIVSAVLLWACCVVGLFSVGMFFVPAAVLMTVAAARRDPVPTSMT
jgi:hypothetical protein